MTDVNSIANDDNDPETTFLECALEIARTVESLEGRSELTNLIALKYAESGELDVAVDVAESIKDSFQKDQTLAGLTGRAVRLGEAEYADKLADMIEDDGAYALATEAMAVAYVVAGAYEKSIDVAHRIDESEPILNQIGLACVANGQLGEALEVAHSIDDAELKAPVLIELAARAIEEGRDTEAQERLDEAIEVAGQIEFPEQQIATLTTIAGLRKKGGSEEKAFEILERAYRLCHEADGFDPDSVRPQLAGGFADLGHYDRADQVIEEIEDPFQYVDATVKVAFAHHEAGNNEKALSLLAEATEVITEEQVYGDQALTMREAALNALALCYATLGHFDQALQSVGMMISLDHQHHARTEIAKLAVASDNNSRAFVVAETIEDVYARVNCEGEIVDAFIASHELELADHTLSQALERAQTIERPNQKALALMAMASRLQHREQTNKAIEVLFDALAVITLIDDAYRQSLALVDLNDKYRELGLEVGAKEQSVLEGIMVKLEM